MLKKAHSAIICGATDCGKTEFTLNLLETEYKDFFQIYRYYLSYLEIQ